MAKSGAAKTVKRALEILNVLATAGGPVGVIDLSKQFKASQSTIFRILSTLVEEGYVTQDPVTDKYALGLQAIIPAGAALNQIEVRKQGLSALERLATETGCNANLAVLYRGSVLYVGRFDGPRSARMYTVLGRLAPAHATALGKAMLAFLPDDEVARIIDGRPLASCTPRTITDPDILRQELARTRTRGYAVDHEEFIQGICCVAVPIRGQHGRIEGAISVSGSAFQVRPDAEDKLAARLQDVSYEISGRLGYIA
ncbi:MAG: IclR family transcriptional regulator [Armatimonadota bacterium]|nr:IclR family transcriptional regulator [Armatimonadota bacterium]